MLNQGCVSFVILLAFGGPTVLAIADDVMERFDPIQWFEMLTRSLVILLFLQMILQMLGKRTASWVRLLPAPTHHRLSATSLKFPVAVIPLEVLGSHP